MAGISSEALGGITSGTASCAWAPFVPAKAAASTAAASPERRWHHRERIMALAFLVLSDPRLRSCTRAIMQKNVVNRRRSTDTIRRQDNDWAGPKVAQNFVVENAETAVPAMILAGGLSRRMGGGDKCLL